MKKFYTLALGLCLAMGASAQVTVGAGENLKAAIDAAEAGSTVTITGDVEITERVDINKNLTLEAINGAKIIVANDFGASRILVNGTADVVFNNIILDGNNLSTIRQGFEIAEAQTNVTMNNVTIQNVDQTGSRTILAKSKGSVVLNNVSFNNCTGTNVLLGKTNILTVKGTGNYNMTVENNYVFKADNFTGNITLNVNPDARTLVNGGKVENFTWGNAPEYWVLKQDGDNVAMAYTKPVAQVINGEETTSYTTLGEAIAAVANGGTIVLLSDVDLTGRALLGKKNVTITSAEGQMYTIKRTDTNKNNLSVECEYTFAMKNVIYDQNNIEITKPIFNLKGHGVFENVIVKNANICSSIIDLTSAKTLIINNMTVVDSEVNRVWCNGGTVTLNGNNNLSFDLAKGSKLAVAKDGALTNEAPIAITLPYNKDENVDGYVADAVVVYDYTDTSKFALPAMPADKALELIAKEGNLVLVDPATLTVADPVVTADETAKTITATTTVGTIWFKVEGNAAAAPSRTMVVYGENDADEISEANGWTNTGVQTYTVENYEASKKYLFAVKAANVASAPTVVLTNSEGVITGVEGIEADENAEVEYFNLQGVRVANPENGVFIRRQGSKVSKVVL